MIIHARHNAYTRAIEPRRVVLNVSYYVYVYVWVLVVSSCLQAKSSRAGETSEPPCQLMRVGGVVRQPRVTAFDIKNRVFSLPLCRQDLIFKIRHRSRLLDFGTKSTTNRGVQTTLPPNKTVFFINAHHSKYVTSCFFL